MIYKIKYGNRIAPVKWNYTVNNFVMNVWVPKVGNTADSPNNSGLLSFERKFWECPWGVSAVLPTSGTQTFITGKQSLYVLNYPDLLPYCSHSSVSRTPADLMMFFRLVS